MEPNDKPGETAADADVLRQSRRRTLVSFAGLGLYAAGGYGAWRWLMGRPAEDDVPWPIRRVLGFNERASHVLFHNSSRMPEQPAGVPAGRTRVNTHIGCDLGLSAEKYRLHLTGLAAGDGTATLTLADLKAMPLTRLTTRLCCVEGWDTWANWGGVRMADVVAAHPPAGTPLYVGMSTAESDETYHVGLDYDSAVHPQTLLVYELDGQPLSPEHGAPVRLAIPTKYGIKNIKQMAHIDFTNARPRDYWAERGYDWYSGL